MNLLAKLSNNVYLYVCLTAIVLYITSEVLHPYNPTFVKFLPQPNEEFHVTVENGNITVTPGTSIPDAITVKTTAVIQPVTISAARDDKHFSINLTNTGILFGKWIKLFPSIRDMVEKIESKQEFPQFNKTTSAKHTMLKVMQTNFVQGGFLNAVIEARDFNNHTKTYGGDYFKTVLYQTQKVDDGGISCPVTDYSNGTYGVKCYIPWHGKAYLRIDLNEPSESLYLLIRTIDRTSEPYVFKNNSFVNSKGEREFECCDMDLTYRYKKTDICDHSNPRNGEPWYCVKTPSGECPPIEQQLARVFDIIKTRVLGHDEYKNKWKLKVDTKHFQLEFEVKKQDFATPIDNSEPCSRKIYQKPSLDIATPTGWLDNYQWKAFDCYHKPFDEQRFSHCISNKNIYLIGDSTVHQWFTTISRLVGYRGFLNSGHSWSYPRRIFIKATNTQVKYVTHGPPFHGNGHPATMPYITDTMDSIKPSSRETHVLFNIGIHFGRYHPDVFLRRIIGIKKSVIKLFARIPNIKIYVIGIHPNKPWVFQLSEWVAYRHEVLLRDTFRDIESLIYLSYWDVLSVADNKKVHLYTRELMLEIGIFQSYLCG